MMQNETDYESPYDYSEKYYKDGQKYTIYYYSYENFQKVLKEAFPNTNFIRRRLTRGFTDGTSIFALDKEHWYSKIGHDKLIRHEIGHIKGKDHTWKPKLMNPTWVLRWF